MKRLTLVLAVCMQAGLAADSRQTLASAAERVKALSAQFQPLLYSQTPREQQLAAACKVNCTPQIQQEIDNMAAGKYAAMDAVALQIHAEIDRYIVATANPKTLRSNRPRIEAGLKQVLSSAADMQPAVFLSDSGGESTLLVAYSLHKGGLMGPGGTSFTIRAYRAKRGRMQLEDATDGDMDGYSEIYVKKLRSSPGDATWLLVAGYLTGANGPNARMRAYICKAGKFRTAWMPANIWGRFTVQQRESDFFVVEWEYYRENNNTRETYSFGSDFITRILSRN